LPFFEFVINKYFPALADLGNQDFNDNLRAVKEQKSYDIFLLEELNIAIKTAKRIQHIGYKNVFLINTYTPNFDKK